MMVLVSYDVSVVSGDGERRLRHIAKACLDYGQRVQFSVFEIELEPDQWVKLKNRLINIIDKDTDSLRCYFLGRKWQHRVEHIGAKTVQDLNGPLIF